LIASLDSPQSGAGPSLHFYFNIMYQASLMHLSSYHMLRTDILAMPPEELAQEYGSTRIQYAVKFENSGDIELAKHLITGIPLEMIGITTEKSDVFSAILNSSLCMNGIDRESFLQKTLRRNLSLSLHSTRDWPYVPDIIQMITQELGNDTIMATIHEKRLPLIVPYFSKMWEESPSSYGAAKWLFDNNNSKEALRLCAGSILTDSDLVSLNEDRSRVETLEKLHATVQDKNELYEEALTLHSPFLRFNLLCKIINRDTAENTRHFRHSIIKEYGYFKPELASTAIEKSTSRESVDMFKELFELYIDPHYLYEHNKNLSQKQLGTHSVATLQTMLKNTQNKKTKKDIKQWLFKMYIQDMDYFSALAVVDTSMEHHGFGDGDNLIDSMLKNSHIDAVYNLFDNHPSWINEWHWEKILRHVLSEDLGYMAKFIELIERVDYSKERYEVRDLLSECFSRICSPEKAFARLPATQPDETLEKAVEYAKAYAEKHSNDELHRTLEIVNHYMKQNFTDVSDLWEVLIQEGYNKEALHLVSTVTKLFFNIFASGKTNHISLLINFFGLVYDTTLNARPLKKIIPFLCKNESPGTTEYYAQNIYSRNSVVVSFPFGTTTYITKPAVLKILHSLTIYPAHQDILMRQYCRWSSHLRYYETIEFIASLPECFHPLVRTIRMEYISAIKELKECVSAIRSVNATDFIKSVYARRCVESLDERYPKLAETAKIMLGEYL